MEIQCSSPVHSAILISEAAKTIWIIGDSHVKRMERVFKLYSDPDREWGIHPATKDFLSWKVKWYGRSGGTAESIHNLAKIKLEEITEIPQWVLVHVGMNDIREPTGVTGSSEFAAIVSKKISALLLTIESRL